MACFSMDNSKKGAIPIVKGIVLRKSLEVSYALSMTSRFQKIPGVSYWTTVKNIQRYLKRTKDLLLVFGGLEEELTVRCYTDASFQTNRYDSHSLIGFVFTLNGGGIYWKSSKHSVVADSTIESEYIAASDAAKEAA
ncbi:secreted RxLR effector protein 161-like [Bidens hawaiensis]|uniref:secreted RxLR effector protein 161-like n=1 Tax=Bidens hawaiensis TaxID=980011 RepID=UPI00404AE45F